MLLTDRQWENVVGMMKANPGTREIVIEKDRRGNAKITCHSHARSVQRQYRGNVVDFPIERIQRPSEDKTEEKGVFSLLWGVFKDIYLDFGEILGLIEYEDVTE